MFAINTATTNINNYPLSQDIGEKSPVKTVGIDVGDILPMQDKAGGQALRGPELTAPSVGLNKEVTSALKEYLLEKMEDPEFVCELNALHKKVESDVDKFVRDKIKEQTEQGKPLDINGLSSSAVALLVAASVLMLLLNKAESELSGKLSLVSFDAAKSTAASMVREGLDSLSGSISQSALQLGITAVGAKMEHKGLKNERNALMKHGGDIENLHKVRKGLGQESKHVIDDIDAKIATAQFNLDKEKLVARGQQTSGDTVMKSSQALGAIAGGSGQYAAALERAEQQISQADSRVATSASEEARESSRKDLTLIQELLRAMDSINQSKNAAIGAVAGNLRA